MSLSPSTVSVSGFDGELLRLHGVDAELLEVGAIAFPGFDGTSLHFPLVHAPPFDGIFNVIPLGTPSKMERVNTRRIVARVERIRRVFRRLSNGKAKRPPVCTVAAETPVSTSWDLKFHRRFDALISRWSINSVQVPCSLGPTRNLLAEVAAIQALLAPAAVFWVLFRVNSGWIPAERI